MCILINFCPIRLNSLKYGNSVVRFWMNEVISSTLNIIQFGNEGFL